MEKVIRNGLVAVLYSPEYGAGWYSWHSVEELLYDPNIVCWLENNEREKITSYMELKYPNVYVGDLNDLKIKWIPVGTSFRIREYDGNESIEIKEEVDWQIA
jgi:hypothetical protein